MGSSVSLWAEGTADDIALLWVIHEHLVAPMAGVDTSAGTSGCGGLSGEHESGGKREYKNGDGVARENAGYRVSKAFQNARIIYMKATTDTSRTMKN